MEYRDLRQDLRRGLLGRLEPRQRFVDELEVEIESAGDELGLRVAVEGFGELFRQLSFNEIGTSTIQSRCLAGLANNTAVFCLPGSTGACRTGWDGIIREQLASTFQPCNFVQHVTTKISNADR